MPLPREVFIDKFLTNVLVGVRNEEYIADRVFPILRPNTLTGKIARMGRDHMRVTFSPRKSGARAYQIDWHADSVPFMAEEWSAEIHVDDQDKPQYDNPFDALRDGAFVAEEVIKSRVEQEVAPIVMTSANYPTDHVNSTTQFWGNSTTPTNPRDAVAAGIEQIVSQTGKSPMGIHGVCSYDVFAWLQQNDFIKIHYINTNPGAANVGMLNRQAIAATLGLASLEVGSAVHDTEKEGAARSTSYIWTSGKFAIYSKVDTPSPLRPNFGYMISPNVPGFSGATTVIDRYRSNENKSDVVRATAMLDSLIVQGEFGYLIDDIQNPDF